MAEPSRTSLPYWKATLAKLVGLPTMPEQKAGADLSASEDGHVLAGQIAPLPISQTRWVLSDLEIAIHNADLGDLSTAARLWRAMKRDGVLAGVLSTRTDGLVRLPIRWSGNEEQRRIFEGRDRKRGLFAAMCPLPELALLAGDGIGLGVGVGEMLRIPIDEPPMYVFRRLEPEFLRYRWHEDRWYYNSLKGPLAIRPGERREDGGWWVLHRPGGESAPWMHGLWMSLARAYIAKEHAVLYRENYSAKLAQAARAAVSPAGATEDQRRGMLSKLIAWGINQCFDLPPGWDVKLIESNGRGYDVFAQTITTSNEEYVISLAGQTVTTTGGTGFANAEIHKTIRADLIQSTADGLALTANEQMILPCVNERWGGGALDEAAFMEWDTSPPKEMRAQADALLQFGLAVRSVNEAIGPYGHRVDIHELTTRFGVPLAGDEQPAVNPRESSPDGGEGTGAVGDTGEAVQPPKAPGAGGADAQGAARVLRGRPGDRVVALLFDRDDWELAEARRWAGARDLEIEDVQVHGTDILLALPGYVARAGAERVELGDGVDAIVARTAARIETPRLAQAPAGARERDYSGIRVVIDRPKGTIQRGTDEDGRAWSRVYQVDYGYLEGTRGGDGEELDAYCGPDRWASTCFVVAQVDGDGHFDEYKLLLGFADEQAARACYTAHTPAKHLGRVFAIPVEMLRGLIGLEPRARGEVLRMALRSADDAARRVA